MNDLTRAIRKVVCKLQTDIETGDRCRHVEVKDLCDVLMEITDEVSGESTPEAKEVAGDKSPCSHQLVANDGVGRCNMSGIGTDSPLTSCEELKGRRECPMEVHEPTEQSYLDTKPLNWKNPERPTPEAKPEHREWADKANAAELRCDWNNAGRLWCRAAVMCRDDSKASAYRDYAGRCEAKCSDEPEAKPPTCSDEANKNGAFGMTHEEIHAGNPDTCRSEAKPLAWIPVVDFTQNARLEAQCANKVYRIWPTNLSVGEWKAEWARDGIAEGLATGGLTACIAACEEHERSN